MKKLLVVHGGGPTPVINLSLLGVIDAGIKNNVEVYGAKGGMAGFLSEDFVRLDNINRQKLELLRNTPASVIGTSRTPLNDNDFDKMTGIAKKHNIDGILVNGGNGTMDACGKLTKAAKEINISVMGIPKTVDNDIAITDHSPGFGSAARYLAGSLNELITDVKSMPIHVCVVETMGRNAGWITASSILAREYQSDAPQLIYLPERTFYEDEFLADVEKIYSKNNYAVVVASEGLKNKLNEPIVEPIFKTERGTYFGDVGTHLASLVIKKLGIKARSEKPGIFARSSIAWQSLVDMKEAYELGEMAAEYAMDSQTGFMVGLKRISDEPYICEKILIPIDEVMLTESGLPKRYINEKGNGIDSSFIKYVRPLIGGELTQQFRW